MRETSVFTDDLLARLGAAQSPQQRLPLGFGRFAQGRKLMQPRVVIQRDRHWFKGSFKVLNVRRCKTRLAPSPNGQDSARAVFARKRCQQAITSQFGDSERS